MKKISVLTLLLIQLVVANNISSKTYYVSPTGTSSNSGSFSSPYNYATALSKSLTAGDSLIFRGGTYSFSSKQSISKSGSSGNLVYFVAYNSEVPVFDFRTEPYNSSNPGISLSGSYFLLKGFIIQGAGDNGLIVSGSNNVIENCIFRWNCDSGLQMKTGSNNLIINCDSYENFDYMTGGTSSPDYGGNADGFADKQYTNTGTNTYRYCRSWLNSDDGWDSYEKVGNTVYDSSWCYANGPAEYDMTDHIRFKTDSAAWFSKFKNTSGRYVVKNYGNGNGFKLGGNYTANNATLNNCVSVANTVKGFDQNNNNGAMTLYNCTGYNNKPDYGFSNASYGTLNIKNSVSLSSKSSNSFKAKTVTETFNSWDTGFSCVTGDFVSLDVTQLINNRQADGSLPDISLLHQKSTSGLIDKGTNVGLTYSGTAPDLGAFEYIVSTALKNVNADVQNFTLSYSAINKEVIMSGDIAAFEFFQLNGLKIYSQKVNSNRVIVPVTNFKKGVYMVRAIMQNGNIVAKKLLIN
ncbi:MAG: hypothetical protein PHS59_15620 [Paludibacter sp.]|nr:hypothetical protein [Paludibacter sp.]